MVLERFLSWLNAAPAQSRADAARALVAAYGRLEGDRTRRDHVDRAIAVLLDDPVVTVRRALADAAACCSDVPRHVLLALSRDTAVVAVPVLRASRDLTAADLIEALKLADAAAQRAVAGRADLPAEVSAVLAVEADADAVLALARNAGAALTLSACRHIVGRFGRDGAIRDALLQRPDLAAEVRLDLVRATAGALTDFAVSCGWMSDRRAAAVVDETADGAIVLIAAGQAGQATLRPFAAALRAGGHLTPALLLRAILSGERSLFEAALGNLAQVPADLVTGALQVPRGLAFASLYRRAALPGALMPAFQAALVAAHRADTGIVTPAAVAQVRLACPEAQPALSTLLQRLEAEGVRDGMRAWRRAVEPMRPSSIPSEPPVWVLPRRPMFRLPSRTAA